MRQKEAVRTSVKSLPVALLRVVLQLHADATDSFQQHGGAVLTVCNHNNRYEMKTIRFKNFVFHSQT